jgi:hypothetical protein
LCPGRREKCEVSRRGKSGRGQPGRVCLMMSLVALAAGFGPAVFLVPVASPCSPCLTLASSLHGRLCAAGLLCPNAPWPDPLRWSLGMKAGSLEREPFVGNGEIQFLIG